MVKTLLHLLTYVLLIYPGTRPFAATQTVTETRTEAIGVYGPDIESYQSVHNGARTFMPSDTRVVNTDDGPALRTVFTAGYATSNYWRMGGAPLCIVVGPSYVTYSGREYHVSCRVKVNHRLGADFQYYDGAKNDRIVQFAIESLWSNNGEIVDPTKTNLPPGFTGKYNFILYENGGGTASGNVKYRYNALATVRTELTFQIDDVVRVTDDDVALINYRWDVTHGPYLVSSIYSKMYMQQLDSNIALTYVKPDGSGSAVIVPNENVTVENTSPRENSNGQIKLKLDSKTGFGPRTSRLRVTVEWQ